MNFSSLFFFMLAIMLVIGSVTATDKFVGHKKTVKKRATIDLE